MLCKEIIEEMRIKIPQDIAEIQKLVQGCQFQRPLRELPNGLDLGDQLHPNTHYTQNLGNCPLSGTHLH